MDKKTVSRFLCLTALQASLLHADDALPGIELLEFLGEMETSNGEWVDVLSMNELSKDKQINETSRVNGDE